MGQTEGRKEVSLTVLVVGVQAGLEREDRALRGGLVADEPVSWE